eukprot:3214177-Lingulodinium_polyedra.AAC.1
MILSTLRTCAAVRSSQCCAPSCAWPGARARTLSSALMLQVLVSPPENKFLAHVTGLVHSGRRPDDIARVRDTDRKAKPAGAGGQSGQQ